MVTKRGPAAFNSVGSCPFQNCSASQDAVGSDVSRSAETTQPNVFIQWVLNQVPHVHIYVTCSVEKVLMQLFLVTLQ
jgi:hypothetical protein